MEYISLETMFTGIPEVIWQGAVLVVGILICLFGLKLVRVWSTLAGIAIGAVLGQTVAYLLHQDSMVVMVATIVAGLILGVLDGVFKNFGIFVLCLAGGCGVAAALIMPSDLLMVAVCAAIGLVAAILAMLLKGPIVIVVTGLMGAVAIAGSVLPLLGIKEGILWYVVPGVAAVIGIVVQFLMKSGEIKRKEIRHAQNVKKESSMESELEQLRSILDEDDEDQDDDLETVEWDDGEDAAD